MAELHPLLAAFANESTLQLTVTGRKSGKQRTATIWFVAEEDHLFVQAGKNGQKGWLVNLRANPEVQLKVGKRTLRGRGTVITDATELQRVQGLFREKYFRARIAKWIGSQAGAGVPVRIEIHGLHLVP